MTQVVSLMSNLVKEARKPWGKTSLSRLWLSALKALLGS
ncbi:hypothetical protein [Pseudomonas sp. 44 R 15]|nr:hypothetical protein [Pseudomonas sp. 44 R 15]